MIIALALGLAGVCTLAFPPSAEASGVSPLTASPLDKKRAQARYEDGTKLFEAKRYPDALKAFQDSYDVVASPNSHLMIARTLREQGQLAAAYDELERVEQEARQLAGSDPAKYGATVDKAAADREALRKRLAVVTVRAKGGEGATFTIAGRPAAVFKPVVVTPGGVEIVGTTQDGRRVVRQIAIAAGGSADVEIDMGAIAPLNTPVPVPTTGPTQPAPADTSPAPSTPPDTGGKKTSLLPYALIAGGLGAVTLGVGIVFGLKNNSTFAEYNDDMAAAGCTQAASGGKWSCPPAPPLGNGPSKERQDQLTNELDNGTRQRLIANIGYGVGGGLLAIGAALVIIDLTRSPSADGATSGVRAPRVAAPQATGLSLGLQTVALQGTF